MLSLPAPLTRKCAFVFLIENRESKKGWRSNHLKWKKNCALILGPTLYLFINNLPTHWPDVKLELLHGPSRTLWIKCWHKRITLDQDTEKDLAQVLEGHELSQKRISICNNFILTNKKLLVFSTFQGDGNW